MYFSNDMPVLFLKSVLIIDPKNERTVSLSRGYLKMPIFWFSRKRTSEAYLSYAAMTESMRKSGRAVLLSTDN